MRHFSKYLKTLKLVVKQCYQTGQFQLDKEWRKMPKLKNSNETFLGDFHTMRNSYSKGVLINATYIVKFYESIRLFRHIPLHFHVIHVTNIIEFALSHNIGRWSTFTIFSDPFDNL